MMGKIKILGELASPIVSAAMPLEESLEWVSPYEENVDGRVKMFFAQSAFSGCVEHASSDTEREVGGLLVGEVRIDPMHTRPYLLIQDILPALHTESGQTHVTFTQDTLVHLHGQIESRFRGKRILGWYHTHPGLGVFLSSYDTWLHENFFNDPTQVALVIDPIAERGGFFCWQINRRLDPRYYVGFYELSDISEESVVMWNNLEPVIETPVEEPAQEPTPSVNNDA